MSQERETLNRRRLFAGAGAIGAAAALAAVLPGAPQAPAVATQGDDPEKRRLGYQLSEHVKRYYQTARV